MNIGEHRAGAAVTATDSAPMAERSGGCGSDAPAGYAGSAGDQAGAAGSVGHGEDELAAPASVPPEVRDIIWREAFIPTRGGGHMARPPADICYRLRLFYHIAVAREDVAAVVAHRRSWARAIPAASKLRH